MRTIILALMLALAAPAVAADDGLYARLGEKAGIARIAGGLLDHALADDRIRDRLANANIPRLKTLLTLHFCNLVGGPCSYPGRSMADAHVGLGLRDGHFNALVECLQEAMDDEGIGFATQNELLALLAPMHADVVKR